MCSLFQRPPFCPIHHLPAVDKEKLAPEIASRGIDTGAATLVESADEKLLLIRRSAHLRTFPGVWVPPGGHLEEGEQVCTYCKKNFIIHVLYEMLGQQKYNNYRYVHVDCGKQIIKWQS